MDTILFFCKKSDLYKPVVEPIGMRKYLLIRVALDVGPGKWFELTLEPEMPAIPASALTQDSEKVAEKRTQGFLTSLLQAFRQRRQSEKQVRKSGEKLRQQRKEERQEQLFKVEASMQRLATEIRELTGNQENCFCVYEDRIRKVLVTEGTLHTDSGGQRRRQEDRDTALAQLWQKYFQIQEFQNYTQQLWVEELLSKATLSHFVILGTAPCLTTVIESCAKRMKSLRWILMETDCNEEVLEYVEDFYMEYGLAIMLQPVPAGSKLQAVCLEASNILDFTQNVPVSLAEVAKGSIWLDMLSVEEKRRKIAGRNDGIIYFSLKEKWKKIQKKAPFVPEF